jgi:hypothetical protein
MDIKKFKQKCIDYERSESSDLFDELWEEIQLIDNLEDCNKIIRYVPVGMLMYRFNQKLDQLNGLDPIK